MASTPMTRQGLEKLKAELEQLEARHPEILKAVREAREKGDLSENAEYDAARETLAMNENNMAHLRQKIGSASIIDPAKSRGDRIVFGATVTLKDLDDGAEEKYTLVGEGEADPLNNKILTTSPMGQALLTHAVGDEVAVPAPKCTLRFEVIGICFE